MLDHFAALCQSAYGIPLRGLQEVAGGWSACAYHLESPAGRYFLKAYDKQRPSVRPWIASMEAYMPVALWLYAHTPLRERMACPLLTQAGSYKAEDARYVYLLFPLIEGETIGDAALSPAQVEELAQIVTTLHQYDASIPVPTGAIRETFDIAVLADLERCLEQAQAGGVLAALSPYQAALAQAAALLRQAAAALQAAPPKLALCHADLHGWNLLQSARLVLLDWEGLLLAPVEADLFVFTEGFFFAAASADFLAAYRRVFPDYRVNAQALRYYQIRRRLTDIVEFGESILHDQQTPPERQAALQGLLSECAQLAVYLGGDGA